MKLLILGFLVLSNLAWGANLQEKDLAVIFPLESNLHLSSSSGIFKSSWLDQVNSAFEKTAIGSAMEDENQSRDWKLYLCGSYHALP